MLAEAKSFTSFISSLCSFGFLFLICIRVYLFHAKKINEIFMD